MLGVSLNVVFLYLLITSMLATFQEGSGEASIISAYGDWKSCTWNGRGGDEWGWGYPSFMSIYMQMGCD